MKRRRDRGEWDCLDSILLFCIMLAVLSVGGAISKLAPDLKRIADVICIDAPPAVPVEEASHEEAK